MLSTQEGVASSDISLRVIQPAQDEPARPEARPSGQHAAIGRDAFVSTHPAHG